METQIQAVPDLDVEPTPLIAIVQAVEPRPEIFQTSGSITGTRRGSYFHCRLAIFGFATRAVAVIQATARRKNTITR